jgi:branched-chain amino acid transport system permease protein
MSAVGATARERRGRGMAGSGRGRVIGGVLLIGLAVLLAFLPYYGSGYDLIVGYQVLQLAALAQAWNLLAGYGGLVSLASAAFVGIGSYATADLLLHAGLPVIVAFLFGGLVAAVFAALVSLPMFRFRGLYFTIGTLVLAELLSQFMLNYNGLGGDAGLTLLGAGPSRSRRTPIRMRVARTASPRVSQ